MNTDKIAAEAALKFAQWATNLNITPLQISKLGTIIKSAIEKATEKLREHNERLSEDLNHYAELKYGAAHASEQGADNAAIQDVLRERGNQQRKWGEQNHEMSIWLEILHEETGELCEADLHAKFGGPKRNNVFNEAVQVAAVALQIVEFLRRQSSPSQRPTPATVSEGIKPSPRLGDHDCEYDSDGAPCNHCGVTASSAIRYWERKPDSDSTGKDRFVCDSLLRRERILQPRDCGEDTKRLDWLSNHRGFAPSGDFRKSIDAAMKSQT